VSGSEAWAPQGALTLQSVGAIRAAASAQVAATGRIDLAAVTEADSAALALLVEMTRSAQAEGRVLEIRNMPAGLKALADLYDIADLLSPDASAA